MTRLTNGIKVSQKWVSKIYRKNKIRKKKLLKIEKPPPIVTDVSNNRLAKIT